MSDRHPCVAGAFYSADPAQLQTSISHYLLPPPTQEQDIPRMLILPHAGHVYCGQVIGAVLSRVCLAQTLIMLCPNHTGQGHPLALWPEGQWFSPLGPVKVDSEVANALLALDAGFIADTKAHIHEHSLEVLLPFLQIHSPQSRIVPISVALHDAAALQRAGQALGEVLLHREALGHKSTIIVSSDMNHFDNQQETLRKDGLALAQLLALQPEALLRTVVQNNITMCGVLPAALAMYCLEMQGECTAELVHYTTSAAVTKDSQKVVGYCGIIVK